MSRHQSTDPPDGVLAALSAQRWVPVLRSPTVEDAVDTALRCRDGGCRVVELTYSTPGVTEAVGELVRQGLVVGVGTVRSHQQVRQAAAAGAAFVVSFFRPKGFVRAADDEGLLAVPAALTPQEVAGCLDEGARAVKLFPGRLLEPGYLGDLRSVLGPVPLLVTGGIPATVDGVRPWLDAGAACVGVGSQLGLACRDGAEVVQQRAAELCAGLAA